MSAMMQGLMLTSRLLATLAISALFFNTAGGAASVDAPEECKPPTDFWGTLFRDVVVGLLSALIGKLPMIIVRMAHKRKAHYPAKRKKRNSWNEHEIRSYVAHVRAVDFLLMVFCLLYSWFLFFFVMAFLANVDMAAQQPFFISFMSSMVQSFILFPPLAAFIYMLLVHRALIHNPHIWDKARQRYDNQYRDFKQDEEWNEKQERHVAEMLRGDDARHNHGHKLDDIDILVEQAKQRRSEMEAQWNKMSGVLQDRLNRHIEHHIEADESSDASLTYEETSM